MTWDDDDDDDDFSIEDLSPEERAEAAREMRARDKRIRSHPLFKKARDILDTANALIESLNKEDKEMYARMLMESAMMLAPKIAGAIAVESWLISMQNASIIRYHAESLLTQTSGLRIFTKADKDYVAVLRKEMEEFRALFNEWVKTFDKLGHEEYDDEWGLFVREK